MRLVLRTWLTVLVAAAAVVVVQEWARLGSGATPAIGRYLEAGVGGILSGRALSSEPSIVILWALAIALISLPLITLLHSLIEWLPGDRRYG
ncbi:MAG: hypothetical protein VKI83_06975 [Synechococcaceae cyanobacterium]|nr:hypothetical protein [Synechococcaceae cyanobacterium]